MHYHNPSDLTLLFLNSVMQKLLFLLVAQKDAFSDLLGSVGMPLPVPAAPPAHTQPIEEDEQGIVMKTLSYFCSLYYLLFDFMYLF